MKIKTIKSRFISLLIVMIPLLCSQCTYVELGKGFYYENEYDALDNGSLFGAIIFKGTSPNVYDSVYVRTEILNIKNTKNYILVLQKPSRAKYTAFLSVSFPGVSKDDTLIDNDPFYALPSDVFPRAERLLLYGNIIKRLQQGEDTMSAINSSIDFIIQKSDFQNRIFSSSLNYYIIDKSTAIMYGPLVKHEFTRKCSDLHLDCKGLVSE